MIIVRISGGLGNQMFQHAVGMMLARAHNCELFWDLSVYESLRSQHSFELRRVFNLATPKADEGLLKSVLGWRGHPRIKLMLDMRHFAWARPRSYISEPHFQYWSKLQFLPENIYLSGYWQSEKYFILRGSTIRDAFNFNISLSDANRSLALEIDSCHSVSVHVRRGDYISSPSANKVHASCSPEYYKRAAEKVLDRFNSAHFYVFSDDPAWARVNLDFPAPCTFVSNNHGADSYCDMQLMSFCKSHIIANSSFSWWGAWLSTASEKLVVAPQQWFKDKSINTSDLYCDGWTLL